MLVLARGVGQEVELCDGLIKLTVLSVQGSIVRIGFEAPREISIVRREVADERKRRSDAENPAS